MEKELSRQFEFWKPEGNALGLEHKTLLAGNLGLLGQSLGQTVTKAQCFPLPFPYRRQHELLVETVRQVRGIVFTGKFTANTQDASHFQAKTLGPNLAFLIKKRCQSPLRTRRSPLKKIARCQQFAPFGDLTK
jgi:hypothetical protein